MATRGGARIGAGRKREGEEIRVNLTVKIDPQTKEKIARLKAKGFKVGKTIDEMIAQIQE